MIRDLLGRGDRFYATACFYLSISVSTLDLGSIGLCEYVREKLADVFCVLLDMGLRQLYVLIFYF